MTDPGKFEALVREYQDMVFATAIRLLGNAADAEDVAQTVFLKAFERFDDIGTSPSVAGWLKTVTTNVCLNHLSRYRSRWRLFSELRRDDADETDRLDAIPSCDSTVMSRLEQASEQERLERALRNLPDRQRVPLVLFHFEEKTYQEIASLLGVSLAKVKTDIHRGREVLKGVLSGGQAHGSR
jgi:RNA polymerase sigma-70 factor (ECF subfamily)